MYFYMYFPYSQYIDWSLLLLRKTPGGQEQGSDEKRLDPPHGNATAPPCKPVRNQGSDQASG